MAEVVEFIKDCDDDDAYYSPNHKAGLDFTDRYVREADYAALLERHRRLVELSHKLVHKYKIELDVYESYKDCKCISCQVEAALAEEVDDAQTVCPSSE